MSQDQSKTDGAAPVSSTSLFGKTNVLDPNAWQAEMEKSDALARREARLHLLEKIDREIGSCEANLSNLKQLRACVREDLEECICKNLLYALCR